MTSVLARHQIVAHDLRIEQAGLDDAFVALTGRSLDADTRRSRMNALRSLTVAETKLFLRDHATGVAPSSCRRSSSSILGAVFGARARPEVFGGQRFLDLFTPSLVVLTLATLGVNTLPTRLATYREKGILRRLSTTPVRPAAAGRRSWRSTSGRRSSRSLLLVIVANLGVRRAAAAATARASSSRSCSGSRRCSPSRCCSRRSCRRPRRRPPIGLPVFFAVMFLGGVYLPR